jgi:hypothetical protein
MHAWYWQLQVLVCVPGLPQGTTSKNKDRYHQTGQIGGLGGTRKTKESFDHTENRANRLRGLY